MPPVPRFSPEADGGARRATRSERFIEANQDETATERHLKPMSFGIERSVTDGVHVVSVRGELDLATAPELRELLEDELEAEAAILIDLTACEFIDSTGIAVIVRAWQQRQGSDGVPGSGGLLGLCSPEKQVSRLLEVTGVDTSISIFEDCETGVGELRNRAERSASPPA